MPLNRTTPESPPVSRSSRSGRSRSKKKSVKSTRKVKNTITRPIIVPRKSTRLRTDAPHVETFPLGDESTQHVRSEATIAHFIRDHIRVNVPVVISLPVPTGRHAFLVFVSSKNKKIMLSDWEDRTIQGKIDKYYYNVEKWQTYTRFMDILQSTYPGYKLEGYPVDQELYQEADEHHRRNKGQLGCSYYIYKWVDRYSPELFPKSSERTRAPRI